MKINSVKEYKEFVQKHNLPLDKMRFALDRKYDKRWFYLYYDEVLGEWIVAKNKDDGSTAIRYRGPSEATACQILFDKMEEEAKNRGYIKNSSSTSASSTPFYLRFSTYFWATIIFFAIICVIIWAIPSLSEGYYVHRATGNVYYHLGDSYYIYDNDANYWNNTNLDDLSYDNYQENYDFYSTTDFENNYGDSYFGNNSDWNFSNSQYYEDYHSSSTTSDSDWSSSDDSWDSWDSDDTDWGSDW